MKIQAGDVILEGNLTIPERASGIVLFAHGSGSSRLSPRNRYVAEQLNEKGLATLLFDLLTADEDAVDVITREFRFDIPRLAKRLVDTTDWLLQQPQYQQQNIGYFGSSTGAAAALIAAAERPDVCKAVVSRGGRPDLANDYLAKVQASTLLIVGELDYEVIRLNEQAKAQMTAETKITIIPGATHLFEEPGTLDQVVTAVGEWFLHFL